MSHALPSSPRIDSRGAVVLELPPELRACDERLHSSAARLLQLSRVRSVSIVRDRSRALVRWQKGSVEAASLEILSARLADGPAARSDSREDGPPPQVVFWTDPRTETLCFIKLPAQVVGWRRLLLLGTALATLMLGLLGILLPGLPTTPFVLLASYCLLRSSPRLHERLLHSRLFGGVLRDWHVSRGIRPHIRSKALAVVGLVVGASLVLTTLPMFAKVAIAAIAAYGIFYIWRLPSIVE